MSDLIRVPTIVYEHNLRPGTVGMGRILWQRRIVLLTAVGLLGIVGFLLPDGAAEVLGIESIRTGWLLLASLALLAWPGGLLFMRMKRRTEYMQDYARRRPGGEEDMQHQQMVNTVALGMEYHNTSGGGTV